MHASDAMGLLAHEFRIAIKKVHAESLQLAGIKIATDMGFQADQEKAVLASVEAEVRRGDALEWAESTCVTPTANVGVSGLVVAQHLWRRTTALQIPTTPWTPCGLSSCGYHQLGAWGPCARWRREPPPLRPQRL